MGTTTGPSGFADVNHVQLGQWEELTGELETITVTYGRLLVELTSGTLSYPAHTIEADLLQKKLTEMEGRIVGILRTDASEHPLAVTIE